MPAHAMLRVRNNASACCLGAAAAVAQPQHAAAVAALPLCGEAGGTPSCGSRLMRPPPVAREKNRGSVVQRSMHRKPRGNKEIVTGVAKKQHIPSLRTSRHPGEAAVGLVCRTGSRDKQKEKNLKLNSAEIQRVTPRGRNLF